MPDLRLVAALGEARRWLPAGRRPSAPRRGPWQGCKTRPDGQAHARRDGLTFRVAGRSPAAKLLDRVFGGRGDCRWIHWRTT